VEELSGAAYADFIAAAVRKDFAAGGTTGSSTGLASTATAVTRASGSFVTDGFKVGDVVNITGFVAAGNNGYS
jgi:small-conductance mechanosensitive channel